MTLNFAFREGAERLKSACCEDYRFDALCLMQKHFNAGRSELALNGEAAVDAKAYEAFLQDVSRRAGGFPLQYILGEWEFMGLPFSVGEGVLIPRPDTETLVEAGLECLKGVERPVVADLCAGSGCVGISIAHFCPNADVRLIEISEKAAGHLTENIRRNAAHNARLISGDILKGAKAFCGLPRFNLILSNPPYIPTGDLSGLQKEVHAEPTLALDGGDDGLIFYRAIAGLWSEQLLPGGVTAVECGINQASAVKAIFEECGLCSVRTVNDLCGIQRVVIGQKSE